jgi:hypothetical protein
VGMLFSENKSDADVLREAGYRSEHLDQRIAELRAAIQTLSHQEGRATVSVVTGANLHGIGQGSTVHLGLLGDTARQFFVAALDEAHRLKNEIDAKLAVARKVLEE